MLSLFINIERDGSEGNVPYVSRLIGYIKEWCKFRVVHELGAFNECSVRGVPTEMWFYKVPKHLCSCSRSVA